MDDNDKPYIPPFTPIQYVDVGQANPTYKIEWWETFRNTIDNLNLRIVALEARIAELEDDKDER